MRPDDISEGFGPVGTNGPSLIERLRTPLSMDLFASKDHMINALLAERSEAAAALEAAREDTARLDFIERTYSGMTNRERYLPVQMIWGKGCNGRTLREACDKYREREARNE